VRSKSGTEELESVQRLYQDYLRAIYVLIKSSFLYDTNNQTLVQSAERVAAAANQIRTNVDDTARLELLPEGVYVNRTLLKLDATTYDQADYVFTVCTTLGVASIGALEDTQATHWLALVAELKRCVGPGGNFAAFADAKLDRIEIVRSVGKATSSNVVAMTNRFRALRAYATTVIGISEVLEAAREERVLRPLRVKRPLQEMISLAEDAGALLLALAHLKRHKLTPEHHLTNTAIFAICAVRPLELSRTNVCALALSAAVHDIGRALHSSDDAQGPASERRFAHKSVRKLVGSPLSSQRMNARAVVASEVRRWIDRRAEPPGDTEYPFSIGVASRIVAVARAYSLLTTPRPDRPGLLPDEALRLIMREAGRRYDAAAVKLFVNALGVFPVGSTIALSDGRLAIVVQTPESGPARPVVKIVRDTKGSIVDGEIVDLAGTRALQPVRCVDAEDHQVNAPAFLLS
jgi:hypothetical protein